MFINLVLVLLKLEAKVHGHRLPAQGTIGKSYFIHLGQILYLSASLLDSRLKHIKRHDRCSCGKISDHNSSSEPEGAVKAFVWLFCRRAFLQQPPILFAYLSNTDNHWAGRIGWARAGQGCVEHGGERQGDA